MARRIIERTSRDFADTGSHNPRRAVPTLCRTELAWPSCLVPCPCGEKHATPIPIDDKIHEFPVAHRVYLANQRQIGQTQHTVRIMRPLHDLCCHCHARHFHKSIRLESQRNHSANYQLKNTHKNDENLVKKPIILHTFSSSSFEKGSQRAASSRLIRSRRANVFFSKVRRRESVVEVK